MTDRHANFARVCVDGGKECGGGSGGESESHDGAATPPRGRGLRPRQAATTTTTNYILSLVCSSSGRASNAKVTLRSGWSA